MSKTANLILFGTIFTTGAAVLIFEVGAVRALSPHFGASIYVVSSVLTIILAALSLGYYFGGRLADKRPHVSVLYIIIGLSGLSMNLLYYFSLYIFPSAGIYLPITFGPLILSALFFLFPAFLLGIDSPFVIKLLTTDDHEHNGAIVGSTFFWSTVGSIVGSLISGFYLIPFLGLRLTFAGTATVLSILSVVAIFVMKRHTNQTIEKRQQYFILAIAVVSIVIAAITLSGDYFSARSGTLLHASDGYYSQIEVRERVDEDGNTIRTLHRGINQSSSIMTGTTTYFFPYAEFSRAYRYFQDETDNMLLIGGGAYTLPRTLLAEEPGLEIDVVEIEPRLYDLAKEYFELPDDARLTNYPIDARIFLNHSEKKYDLIFGDAFQSGHFIPPHLATREFIVDIKEHLTDEGVFIVNVIGAADQDKLSLTGSLIKTIESVFPNLETYTAYQREGVVNLMIIARANGESSLLPAEFVVDLKNGNKVPATDLWVPLDSFFLDKQVVFTDDRSMVEPLVSRQIFDYF